MCCTRRTEYAYIFGQNDPRLEALLVQPELRAYNEDGEGRNIFVHSALGMERIFCRAFQPGTNVSFRYSLSGSLEEE